MAQVEEMDIGLPGSGFPGDLSGQPWFKRAAGGQMAEAQKLSAQVAQIVFCTTNIEECERTTQMLCQYNDTYRNEPTEPHRVQEIFVSSEGAFPQAVVQMPVITSNGAGAAGITQTNIVNKIPINQFVSMLFCRIFNKVIRSFKNGLGLYSRYSIQAPDSQYHFVAASDMNTITTVLRMGVGKSTGLSLNFLASQDFAHAGAYAGAPFANANANVTANIQGFETNLAQLHGPNLYSRTGGDRTWTYADATMIATPSCAPGYNQVSGAYSGQQPIAGPYTVAQVGSAMTGCHVFYWGVAPLFTDNAQSIDYTINQWGWNEGTPYICQTLSGQIQHAASFVDTTIAVFTFPFDDYYGYDITTTITNANNVAGSSASVQIGLLYFTGGEGWAHLAQPGIGVVAQEFEQFGWIASNLWVTNGTPIQFRGGFQAGVQPPRGTPWQSIVDNGNPFDHITQRLRQKAIDFTEGGYTWLRAADDQDYLLQDDQKNDAGNGVGGYNVEVPLNDLTFIVHCINAPLVSANQGAQLCMFNYQHGCEMSTDSLYRSPQNSRFSKDAWTGAAEILKSIPQLMTNKEHNFITTLKSGIKSAVPKVAQALQLAMQYLPYLIKAAPTVAAFL